VNSPAASSIAHLTDEDVRLTLLRALRLVAILGVAGSSVLLLLRPWPTAALFFTGALVSASGIWEWRKLTALINAKLDNAEAPGSARVLIGFLLRLGLAGAVLYGSLRCFHGSVYALVAGVALAVVALLIEALRLFSRT
jgi:hypothetical protein